MGLLAYLLGIFGGNQQNEIILKHTLREIPPVAKKKRKKRKFIFFSNSNKKLNVAKRVCPIIKQPSGKESKR